MSPHFESLGSVSGACLGVLLALLAAHGLGWLVAGTTIGRLSRVESAILRVTMGLTLLGSIGVTLGLFGWLADGRPIVLLAAGGLLPIALQWLNLLNRTRKPSTLTGIPAPRPPLKSEWGSLAIRLFVALAAILTLGPALCYPTGWDELVYHHELPRRWLAAGWPAFYADLPYSGFPSLAEILFWLIAPLENVVAPRLFMWICWIASLLLIHRLLRRRVAAPSAAALTSAFALSSPLLMISSNCYVESLLLLNVSAILLVLESRHLSEARPSLGRTAMLIGILTGGAAAVKLTGCAVLPLPCLWYFLEAWTGRLRLGEAVRAVAICLLVAAVVAAPFYLRPWLLTGNPFYPYLAGWFTTDAARLEMSQYHHALGAAFGARGPMAFLTGPLRLAFHETLYDGAFGWQLLLLLFLAILALASLGRSRSNRRVLWPAAVTAWLYLFWFFSAQQARFAAPAALGLVLLAAAGLRRFRGKSRIGFVAMLFVATCISLPWRTAGHYLGSWLTAVGVVRSADYVNVSTDGAYLPMVIAVEEHTPPDAKLLLLFEHRGFYFPRPYTIGTPYFQEQGFTPPEHFNTPENLLRHLADLKITHLLMHRGPAGPDQPLQWIERQEVIVPVITACINRGDLRTLWQSERYILLKTLSSP